MTVQDRDLARSSPSPRHNAHKTAHTPTRPHTHKLIADAHLSAAGSGAVSGAGAGAGAGEEGSGSGAGGHGGTGAAAFPGADATGWDDEWPGIDRPYTDEELERIRLSREAGTPPPGEPVFDADSEPRPRPSEPEAERQARELAYWNRQYAIADLVHKYRHLESNENLETAMNTEPELEWLKEGDVYEPSDEVLEPYLAKYRDAPPLSEAEQAAELAAKERYAFPFAEVARLRAEAAASASVATR